MEQLPSQNQNPIEDQPAPLRPEYLEKVRRKVVLEELKNIRHDLMAIDMHGHYAKEVALSKKIKEAHPLDYHTYQMWHLLVHGTIDKSLQPNFDFEDELSVEKFIREEAATLDDAAAVK